MLGPNAWRQNDGQRRPLLCSLSERPWRQHNGGRTLLRQPSQRPWRQHNGGRTLLRQPSQRPWRQHSGGRPLLWQPSERPWRQHSGGRPLLWQPSERLCGVNLSEGQKLGIPTMPTCSSSMDKKKPACPIQGRRVLLSEAGYRKASAPALVPRQRDMHGCRKPSMCTPASRGRGAHGMVLPPLFRLTRY